jgi:hypothetical protein
LIDVEILHSGIQLEETKHSDQENKSTDGLFCACQTGEEFGLATTTNNHNIKTTPCLIIRAKVPMLVVAHV